LRFDLQVGKINTDEYFRNVQERANTLFESSFQSSDNVIIVLNDYKWKKRKIRFQNFPFRQIENLQKCDINYRVLYRLYEPDDKFDIWNQAIIQTTIDKVNYKNILAAIGNADFPPRQPRLDKSSFWTSKEIFFINLDKPLIFNMYDDRGLDIIASKNADLAPIYLKHKEWILEYDRELIEKRMKNGLQRGIKNCRCSTLFKGYSPRIKFLTA
jgi:hypothetical protein